jgi:nitrogen regulatory protein P-II 1
MRKVEAIIRIEKFEDVREALKRLGYPGMTKIPVEGHGKQKGLQQQFRGTTFEMDFLPKLKVEIVVLDEDVPKILNAIAMAARTGDMGDGKIFVLPIDNAVRIRTGEDGDNAI